MTKSEAKPAIATVNELFAKSPDGLREIVGRRVVPLGRPLLRDHFLRRIRLVAHFHRERGNACADEAVLIASDETVSLRFWIALHLEVQCVRDGTNVVGDTVDGCVEDVEGTIAAPTPSHAPSASSAARGASRSVQRRKSAIPRRLSLSSIRAFTRDRNPDGTIGGGVFASHVRTAI